MAEKMRCKRGAANFGICSKYGAQIGYDQNWKGRAYDTYTFAAPVTYGNGTTYLGVIVTKDKVDSRYYVHEVVDESGDIIYQAKENPASTSDGTSALAGDLDTVVDAGGNGIINGPTGAYNDAVEATASETNIRPKEAAVNGNAAQNSDRAATGIQPENMNGGTFNEQSAEGGLYPCRGNGILAFSLA